MESRKEVGSGLIRDQARGWTVVLGCCDCVVLLLSARLSPQTGFLFPRDKLWQFSSSQLHSFLKNHQNLDSSNTDPDQVPRVLWSRSRAADSRRALERSSSFAQDISCSFLLSCISPSVWVAVILSQLPYRVQKKGGAEDGSGI